ncbi:MAG: coenzyme F420-0:L-glutamate ligase [Blastocatellia bacterium]|nr:coenzyme F420-0:L-glutamate ligase [Blastocatellia bacterium]
MSSNILLSPILGIPEVRPGDDIGALIARAASEMNFALADGDIIVVAQKIISKAEGRLVDLESIVPSQQALEIAGRQNRDPRLIEVILSESTGIVRLAEHVLITETRHGFVCANSGVDQSNVSGEHCVSLLPLAPDDSASSLKSRLAELLQTEVTVIITDTFGRPWREGLTNVAIGIAGMKPLHDFRGEPDDFGRVLSATVLAVADELAAAAGLLMKKTTRIPAVVIRGYDYERREGSARELVRAKERDLFRIDRSL